MTQFLGIGSSGVFAIDHIPTAKPYDVCGRAQALEDLAKNEVDRDLISFGCRLDQRLQPHEPPDVKWVNWRWPRYEWKAEVLGAEAKVCRQWVVHGRAVLAQTILQNLRKTSVTDLQCHYHSKMLIRDLDYVDPTHRFNDDSLEGSLYHEAKAPGGFGRITVHDLLDPSPNFLTLGKPESQSDPEQGPDSEYEEYTSRRSTSDARETSVVSSSRDRSDGPHSGRSEVLEHTGDSGGDDGSFEARDDQSQNQIWQIQDTWSLEQTKAVASIMVAYENGRAVEMDKMDTEDTIQRGFQLGPRGSEHDFYEIVTAFKLVPLPECEVNWKNLFITPEEVDVSEILQKETRKIWGECEGAVTGQPWSNFGLSGLKTSEDIQGGQKRTDTSGKGTSTTDSALAEAVHEKTSSTKANMFGGDRPFIGPKKDDDASSRSSSGSYSFSDPHGQPEVIAEEPYRVPLVATLGAHSLGLF